MIKYKYTDNKYYRLILFLFKYKSIVKELKYKNNEIEISLTNLLKDLRIDNKTINKTILLNFRYKC